MEAIAMENWRRHLLVLEQAVREARDQVNAGLGPDGAQHAYEALDLAQRALDDHYAVRPALP